MPNSPKHRTIASISDKLFGKLSDGRVKIVVDHQLNTSGLTALALQIIDVNIMFRIFFFLFFTL
jgi:hypothetical protein